MPTNRRRSAHRPYSRRLVFHTSNPEQRDLFLKHSMDMLKNEAVKVETRLDRIELEIFGNQDRVETIVQNLYILDTRIFRATNPDSAHIYMFHPDLLSKHFKPSISRKTWIHLLNIHDFQTELADDNSIRTDADFETLQTLHATSVDYLKTLPSDVHRDIQRFLLGVALETGQKEYELMIQRAVQHDLLAYHDDELTFAIDRNKAHEELVNLLSTKDTVILDESESDLNIGDLLFEGGRIVFLRNGEEIDEPELDHSSYDGEDEELV